MKKKLFIIFNDGQTLTVTMRGNNVNPMKYFNRYPREEMKSAILKEYPLKDHEAINLLKDAIKIWIKKRQ